MTARTASNSGVTTRWDENGNELSFEQRGLFAVNAEESEYLNDRDDDTDCSEEKRTESRDRHSSD